MNFYKEIWSRIGGRPWTYIFRDIWHKYEWLPQMQWAWTGIGVEYLRHTLGWPLWIHAIWIALYTYGYIQGHIHWGTKYIPEQKG